MSVQICKGPCSSLCGSLHVGIWKRTTFVKFNLILIIAVSYIWRYGSVVGPPCPSPCIRGEAQVGRAHLSPLPWAFIEAEAGRAAGKRPWHGAEQHQQQQHMSESEWKAGAGGGGVRESGQPKQLRVCNMNFANWMHWRGSVERSADVGWHWSAADVLGLWLSLTS